MDLLARIAHDVGLAVWFGGAWMGSVGLNGATIEVDDHTQRTRVANAGWFRWAPIVAVSAAAHLVAALLRGRLVPTPDDAPPGVRLRALRTVVTAVAVAATAETGISGQRVVRGGDVPVSTAVRPIAATPTEVAAAQRRLRVAQWVVPVATGAIWVVNAFQDRRG